MSLVLIKTKDITRNIILESYKMDSAPLCEEWQDANGIFHKVKIRERVTGSFQVMCAPQLGMTVEAFEQYLVSAKNTTTGTYNLTVEVTNKGEHKTIDAFLTVSTGKYAHRVTTFEIKVEEA